MTELEGLNLYVPPMWERGDEWQEVYAAAGDLERPLIKTLGRLGKLLREVEEGTTTPLNLAWLSLWTKVFHCCDGARGALQRQTLYTARILRRVIFETSLHLGTIIQPLIESAGGEVTKGRIGDLARNESVAKKRVRDRLEAYAAWCIHGDLEYWRVVSDERNLRGVYDPAPREELLEAFGDEREAWEDLLGKVNDPPPEGAEVELEKTRRNVRARIEKLKTWLRHPRLQEWGEKLNRLRADNDRPPTFFELFDEREWSVGRRLNAMGTGFGYLEWKRGSQAMHGDTLELALRLVGPFGTPLVGAGEEEMEHEMSTISSSAQWSALALYMIRPSRIDGG